MALERVLSILRGPEGKGGGKGNFPSHYHAKLTRCNTVGMAETEQVPRFLSSETACASISPPPYLALGIARVVSPPSPISSPPLRAWFSNWETYLPSLSSFFSTFGRLRDAGVHSPPPLQPRYSIIIIGRTSERSLRLQFSPPLLPLPPPLYPSRRALDPGEWKEGAAQLHTHTSIEKGEAKLGGEEEGTEIEEKTVQKIFSGGLHHSCLFGESLLWSGHCATVRLCTSLCEMNAVCAKSRRTYIIVGEAREAARCLNGFALNDKCVLATRT